MCVNMASHLLYRQYHISKEYFEMIQSDIHIAMYVWALWINSKSETDCWFVFIYLIFSWISWINDRMDVVIILLWLIVITFETNFYDNTNQNQCHVCDLFSIWQYLFSFQRINLSPFNPFSTNSCIYFASRLSRLGWSGNDVLLLRASY